MDNLYFIKILKNLNIKYPARVAYEITSNNYYYYYHYKKHKIKTNRTHIQFGGKKIEYEFDNKKFIFFVHKEDKNLTFISVHNKNDEEQDKCLFIQIDSEINIAYIQNISYLKNCAIGGLSKTGGGTVLLKLAIDFVKRHKDKYNVNKIQIKDNALKFCNGNKKNINLALLSTLTTGKTWYGKYGFVPFNEETFLLDVRLCTKFNINKKIMDSTKVKDTNVEKYIRKALVKFDMENDIDDINGLFEHYNNRLLRDFLQQFTKQFDKTCILFSYFYERLANDLKLYDFYGKSFYLAI